MSERRWENVWAEIVAKARDHLKDQQPVLTLGREVPNQIVEVTPTYIRRRSAEPKSSAGESVIRSAAIQDLWEQLVDRGETYRSGPVAFSFALIARFIEGIEFRREPFGLVVQNQDHAMTEWQGEGSQHFLLKWSPKRQHDTIEQHRSIAEQQGLVWWGLMGTARPKDQRFREFGLQLAGSATTYAYLYETGRPANDARCWRTRVLDFTADADVVDEALHPDYYTKAECHSFVQLTDFTQLPAGWAAETLALADAPNTAVSAGALRSQTTPMYVVHFIDSDSEEHTHTWWVNQGATYNAHRDGGFVWAPVTNKNGHSIGYHTNVSKLKPGHVIVHYANSAIRALGEVLEAPDIRANPSNVASANWGDEGHHAQVRYHELERPIALSELDDRDPVAGPFASDGSVKQGYLFALASGFADDLRRSFSDRWPAGSPWGSRDEVSHWLFQANPKMWDLAAELDGWKVGEEDTWTATRYRDRMNPGDLVALWTGGDDAAVLALAELTGKPYEGPKPAWRNRDSDAASTPDSEWRVPLRLTRVLSEPLPKSVLASHPSLSDLGVLRFSQATNYPMSASQWEALLSLTEDETQSHRSVAASLRELGTQLLLEPVTFLEDVEQLLVDKRQVIFYGPPGTGKTFIARQLATFLARSQDGVEVVQLHPSYAYEDFVHGFRPVTSKTGQPTFELTPGPLLRLAARAEKEPNRTFVLVVDEINRGNVAKVFGELYFLLEYRREKITLQYRTEPFLLPPNLWMIGTMNTADRSIALVDAALRRRFHFVPFYPTRPPIEGLLRRWLIANNPDYLWLADVVDQVNSMIPDENLGIGPSHFIRKDFNDTWISLIWTHSILPYLEEQYLDDPRALKQFRLDKLKARVDSSPEQDLLATDAESNENDE